MFGPLRHLNAYTLISVVLVYGYTTPSSSVGLLEAPPLRYAASLQYGVHADVSWYCMFINMVKRVHVHVSGKRVGIVLSYASSIAGLQGDCHICSGSEHTA